MAQPSLSSEADASASLHRYIQVLNDALDYRDKLRIIESLWAVAYADGELDKHEEHLLRRLGDLLYVQHSDWIRLKLKFAESE